MYILWTILQITLSDEEMTKIEVIDLDELYNFVIDDFFNWNHFVFKNIIWSYHILKFKFKLFKQSLMEKWPIQKYGKMTNIKVADLDKLYNFVVDNFFIWNHLLCKKIIWISYIIKFKFYIVQSNSDGEMTKRKLVDLNEFYNFVFGNVFIWVHLVLKILIPSSHIFKLFFNNYFCMRLLKWSACESRFSHAAP